MVINTDNLVSITEANQNFSRVARMVDENGAAVILKNNVPRYVLMEVRCRGRATGERRGHSRNLQASDCQKQASL